MADSYFLADMIRANDGTWLPAPGDSVLLGACTLAASWPPDTADASLYNKQEFDIDWRTPFLVVSVTPRKRTKSDGTTHVFDVVIMQNGRLGWFKRRIAG